jgi:DNA polymerase I-like protein with 3'-5' exonuclease and polymerase domains
MRTDLLDFEEEWMPPSSLPDLTSVKRMAIDLETRDPNLTTLGPGWCRDDGNIIGIAIAAGDFVGYFPIRHEGGGNMPEKTVFNWLKKQLATPHIEKVMHNALYDLGWLRWAGIDVQGPVIDTMIAAPLLNENRRFYNLNSLCREYLEEGKSEVMLRSAAAMYGVDPKSEMWKLHASFVGRYAEKDAEITLKLWDRLSIEIKTDNIEGIFKLESSLLPVLLDMKERGVRVDVDKAEQTKKKLVALEQNLLKEVKDETGIWVEPWAASSIAKVFDKLGLSYKRTAKTNAPAFTKVFLANHVHPVAQKIVRLREFNKANTTFIETILKHEHNGRIHCDFNPLRSDEGGTVTGRFSSSHPNLQQQPARDPEIKKMIRGLFLPEEGEKWGSFDYASQEPRWLAHYCWALKGPYRSPLIDDIVKMYHEGNADFHQMVADMAGVTRKEAKTVNLGIMYGMGRKKLGTTLDISEEEAKRLLEEYHLKVPFVKGMADLAANTAAEHGIVRTWLGRKCHFNMWEPRSYEFNKALPLEEAAKEYGGRGMIRRAFTYKALNRLIQGSSADQTKKAMVECYKEGLLPLLTVHDELCFSVNSREQADKIVEIMKTCVHGLAVPFDVDSEIGENWGEVG